MNKKMSPQGAVPCGDIRVFEKAFSANHPAHEINDEWDRDAGDAYEVDDDAGVDHLGDRDVARCIDDGVRRGRDWEHEAEGC